MSTDYFLVCPETVTYYWCGGSRGLFEEPNTLHGGTFEFLEEHNGKAIYFVTIDQFFDNFVEFCYSIKETGWKQFIPKTYEGLNNG